MSKLWGVHCEWLEKIHCVITKLEHHEAIEWKHFPRYWPFVWGIHWSPVNSLHKGQWHGALMFSLICTGINNWVNIHEAGDFRCMRTHYDVTVMIVVYNTATIFINSLWPDVAIWLNKSKSALAQVWAWCWRHQAITWINVNSSSVRHHLKAISLPYFEWLPCNVPR